MDFLLKGLAIGFAVAAPVGPVGLLTIRRSLAYGRVVGFVTGMGAAAADGLFGAVAAFGLSRVTTFFTSHTEAFRLVGGIAMVILGIHAMRSRPEMQTNNTVDRPSLGSAFLSTLAITLTNPVTIMGFVFTFSAFKAHPYSLFTAAELTTGVFLGSSAWWLLLSAGTVWSGNRLKPTSVRWINIVAGTGIAAMGAWQLARAVPVLFS